MAWKAVLVQHLLLSRTPRSLGHRLPRGAKCVTNSLWLAKGKLTGKVYIIRTHTHIYIYIHIYIYSTFVQTISLYTFSLKLSPIELLVLISPRLEKPLGPDMPSNEQRWPPSAVETARPSGGLWRHRPTAPSASFNSSWTSWKRYAVQMAFGAGKSQRDRWPAHCRPALAESMLLREKRIVGLLLLGSHKANYSHWLWISWICWGWFEHPNKTSTIIHQFLSESEGYIVVIVGSSSKSKIDCGY